MKATSLEGLKVPFGIKQGRLYSPGQVDNGLRCGCHCPQCNAQLIANHPKIKRPYFAHHKAEECKGGYETALHLMAKQIIEDAGKVVIPPITLEITAETFSGFQVPERVAFKAREVELFNATQEVSAGRWRPDLTAQLKNSSTVYIEILVSHAVEPEKAESLDNLMEIDLSQVTPDQVADLDTLAEVVTRKAPRHWFNCSLYNEVRRVEHTKQKLESWKVGKILGQKVKSYSITIADTSI